MSNVEDIRDYGCFIPSFLDDFGLDTASFRLYTHISRRAGSGLCWESIDKMAEVCRINRKTAYKAFKFLQDHRLILVEKRKGQTSLITLTHHSVWIPVPNQVHPATSNRESRPIPDQVHGYPKSGTTTCTKSGTGGIPNQVQPPVPNQVHKGTPIEGNPIKEKELALTFSDSEGGTSEEGHTPSEITPSEIPHTSQSNVSAAPVDKVSQQPQWHGSPNPDDRFLQKVPEWRVSNKRNAYQEWIIEYVRLVVLPKTSPVIPMGDDGKHTVGQAINWLSNCELKGDLGCGKIAGYLEDAKAWWQKQASSPQQTQTTVTPEQVDRWLLVQAAKGDPVTVVNNLFDNPLDWTVRFGKRGGFTAKLRDVFDSSCLEIGTNT